MDPQRDAYAQALGELAMEAAQMEQQTKAITCFLFGGFALGMPQIKGKGIESVSKLADRQGGHVLQTPALDDLRVLMGRVRTAARRRNELIHAAWMKGRTATEFDMVMKSFDTRAGRLTAYPKPIDQIQAVRDEIAALAIDLTKFTRDELFPGFKNGAGGQ